jgi:hypothetical protein
LLGFDDFAIEQFLNPPEASEDGERAEPEEGNFSNQYAVTVICDGESHQQEIFEKLTGEGLNCKVVCV